MANVLDILIQAKDLASGVMEKVGAEGADAAKKLEENWLAVGLATAGAGLALEGLARHQAPLTEQTNKLAASMGMTEDEVRNMAIAAAGAGDPLNEVLAVMEMGRKQGIQSAEQLQKYAEFWDTVGDATGESGVALSEAGAALRAVGIAAGEESQAIAAMGFIQRETTGTVSEFLSFIGRTGPQLREMGMDVNDAATVLGVLEGEFGMSGKMARTQFNQAVQEAEGDMSKLLATLGITAQQFDAYKTSVLDSSGVIQENADIHAQSYTIIQQLEHAAAEMTYQYGDLIGVVGNLSPVLMATGPLIQAVIAGKKAWAFVTSGELKKSLIAATAKMKLFSAVLLANPIALVLVAVAALAAGAVTLVRNWGTVGPFFSRLWSSVTSAFSTAVTNALTFIQNLWTGATTRFTGMVNSIRGIVADITEAIAAPFRRAQEIVGGITTTIGGFLNRINPLARRSPSLVDDIRAGVREIQREYGKLDAMQMPRLTPAIAGMPAAPADRTVAPARPATIAAPVHQGPLFIVETMNVRSEADIEAISRQLHRHIQAATRARGGR